jgi:hypothetical protein
LNTKDLGDEFEIYFPSDIEDKKNTNNFRNFGGSFSYDFLPTVCLPSLQHRQVAAQAG